MIILKRERGLYGWALRILLPVAEFEGGGGNSGTIPVVSVFGFDWELLVLALPFF